MEKEGITHIDIEHDEVNGIYQTAYTERDETDGELKERIERIEAREKVIRDRDLKTLAELKKSMKHKKTNLTVSLFFIYHKEILYSCKYYTICHL